MKKRVGILGGLLLLLGAEWGCRKKEEPAPSGSACPAGLTECGAGCALVASDPAHCGGCDSACAAPQVCSLGVCSQSCASGLTECGGACADLLGDPAHCGGCGQACAGGLICAAGSCVNTTSSTGANASSTTSSGTTSPAASTMGGSTTAGSTTGGGEPLQCSADPMAGEGGVVVDDCCAVLCAYGDLTDADASGALDGWGWEQQAECVVPGSAAAGAGASCLPEPRSDLPEPGDGYWFPEVGDPPGPRCVRPCDDAAADAAGAPDGDGWGWEYQDTCIVPGSRAAAEGIPCVVEGGECNGTGYSITIDGAETCPPPCQYGALTDVDDACMPDGDGWGWERGANCLVPGSPAAPQELCCEVPLRTGLPAAGSGYMADLDGSGVFGDAEDEVCMPPCGAEASYEEGCTGWGYEDGLSCIDAEGIAAAQLVPCVYEELTSDPPPGTDWDGDYTTTFFGEDKCQSQGADDLGNTNLNQSVCVSNGALSLCSFSFFAFTSEGFAERGHHKQAMFAQRTSRFESLIRVVAMALVTG